MDCNKSNDIQQQVLSAYENNQRLTIVGGNSKAFYGNALSTDELHTSSHTGIISYEPTELVITARAGTTLQEITELLDSKNQMLGFEPPSFSPTATIGGTVACNFSGPRRAYAGAARDFLLGCQIINGKAEKLTFGGEVMKNVAGYDVSRLMAGAMGTLGVILECSIKTLPKPEAEVTQSLQLDETSAIKHVRDWAQRSLPISATCFIDSQLYVRVCGTKSAVASTTKKIGGETVANDRQFWQSIKEQQHDFFSDNSPLWRLSIDPTAPSLNSIKCAHEWSGSLRWAYAEAGDSSLREYAEKHGGHATLFRHHSQEEKKFQPLAPELKLIHQNLKKSFDPKGILNYGKMYSDL